MKTVFIRAIEAALDEKAELLRVAAREQNDTRFDTEIGSFGQVPRSPFAYWTSETIRSCFARHSPLESDGRTAKQGLATADDFRFVRLATEVSPTELGPRWIAFAKGGAFAKFYADIHLVVDWAAGGRNVYGYSKSFVRNPDLYFRPGLTWTLRTTSGLSFRALPAGCIFGHKGPAAFVDGDKPQDLLALCALAVSKAFDALLQVQLAAADAAARSYEVGVIQRTPVPNLDAKVVDALAAAVRRSWYLRRRLDTRAEPSHAFLLPAVLQVSADTLLGRTQSWAEIASVTQAELDVLAVEIDDYAFRLYGISGEDQPWMEQGLGPPIDPEAAPESDEGDEAADDDTEIDASPMVASLLSWSLGVALGRFDVRLATDARPLPPDPDPFDPLPVCSPGMLTSEDGLPFGSAQSGYPLTFPTDGILVDDPGHPRDLLKAVRAVFHEVFDDANARWHEAAELVGARGGDLRDWFARTFFGEHIKRYSKSRRKAPIYWQLATASGSYSVWVYIHRATPDTLFRVLNDFVGPKLDHEREKLDRLTRDAGPNPSRTDRDALAVQEAFVDELQALRAEVARVAPLWKPDLDDGVILNFAPLWRLVPQERSWQTECRKAWDKLCAGEYDWAHLGMHLWPERVVPKCADDRSLAIAHDLEDVFWREDGSGNWHQVEVPQATLAELIEERTSSSVKAALKDLLAAPAPTGKSGGRRAPSTPARAPSPRRAAAAASAPARAPTADVDEATLTAVCVAIAAVAEGASKADVQATTGLSDADWNRAIAALLERGDVTRTGQKRGTRYHAKGDPHA
jgi:hypothetical protein